MNGISSPMRGQVLFSSTQSTKKEVKSAKAARERGDFDKEDQDERKVFQADKTKSGKKSLLQRFIPESRSEKETKRNTQANRVSYKA